MPVLEAVVRETEGEMLDDPWNRRVERLVGQFISRTTPVTTLLSPSRCTPPWHSARRPV